ncbi:hypothetical protein GcC1_207033 [Golovinomyces cichoracearum]|uniref:Uncharacterized protein n=1 Tax=Golovinomyces cichoracearum TaxID=62708 RepID=A0A420HC17_9PEZI|nr:hypothetical protein GcC1_207033 [Golovinomyces cichoracearum]
MPSQCSFFANFLAAFRAHAVIQQGKTSSSKPPQQTQSVANNPHSNSPTQPQSITSNAKAGAAAAATTLSSLHSPRNHSTSPLSRSPGPQPMGTRYIPSHASLRRGSDSSTEGFREVRGAEKWYIGGRTATGEEKYFKLGVIKRQKSRDRLSLDQLSL